MKGVQLFFIILLFALSQATEEEEEGSLPCLANHVEIVCNVIKSSQDPDDPKSDYRLCMGDKSIISTSPASLVSSVVYEDGCDVKNPSSITGLAIKFATITFIPTGFRRILPNLKGLMIYKCGLMSVSKSNLKQFGDSLKYLVLDRNEIMYIDADLFEFNPNLKEISFDENPIRRINPEFFTNLKRLKNLQLVEFHSCTCINHEFNYKRQDISTFTWDNYYCKDFFRQPVVTVFYCGTQPDSRDLF